MNLKEKLKNLYFYRLSTAQKIFFVQQLGIMIKTGISLSAGLEALKEQTTSKGFKIILEDLRLEVEKGNLLSQGLIKYEKVFGELFINMVKSGEASGKLEEVFKELFVQMKKDHAIISKVKSAMIYPSVVIVAMIAVVIFVMIYVIPSLTKIFEEMNVPLPFATKALIAVSNFSLNYGLFIAIALLALIATFIKIITTKKGKYIFHGIFLKTPILGDIIKKINLARFCRTISSLLNTDIAIVESFEITANILKNHRYKKALMDVGEKLKKGKKIKESLAAYKDLFPPVILQMVSVGEETGSLDSILEESATFYEETVDRTMSDLPSIIEPVLIVILGFGVAGMAVAIIMPMYSLGQEI